MTTYKITIKDNSIPEWIITNPHAIREYTATMQVNEPEYTLSYLDKFIIDLKDLIEEYAVDLDTDPESLEILSIIKQ